jgi:hypothetical protein
MATPAADSTARELDALTREAARLRHDASLAKADSLRSARALLDVESQLALALARVTALEARLEECSRARGALASRLERAERVGAAMQASLSWQLTAPLRALKRRV